MKILNQLFFIISLSASAQKNYSLVEGTLIDSISGGGVAYANIFIKNFPNAGTFSNEIGEFRFQFKDTLQIDTLVISAIGYNTKFLPLKPLLKRVDKTVIYHFLPLRCY